MSHQKPIYLIGLPSSEELSMSRLPTTREVLLRAFHYTRVEYQLTRISCYKTAVEVLNIWRQADIPTISISGVVTRMKKLYQKWESLHKGANRKTKIQKHREKVFQDLMPTVFDISNESRYLEPLECDFQYVLATP